jgi:drug/metabolite transporter (DMT)-like permease
MTDTVRGILAMIAAMFMFNIGDTLFKLMGAALPIGEMLFLRGVFATVIVTVAAWQMGVLPQWRRLLTWPIFVRAVCEMACSLLFFVALMRMNFSDAAAIGQFTPLAIMAGAAVFLRESVGWRRWTAAAVGLLGVLLIIKPGTSAFQPMALVMLVSMAFVAARDLITRRLPKDVPTVLLTLTSVVSGLVLGAFMQPFEVWQAVSVGQIGLLVLCAVSVLFGYGLVIVGMRFGETGVVSPFRYAYMLFALLSSLIIFHERPDAWSWAGIGLVVSAGLYMVHRERVVGGGAAVKAQDKPAVAAG